MTTTGGKYKITGLQAPASYQLTFTTAGYQASTLVDTVNGGDTRLEPTVTLGAARAASPASWSAAPSAPTRRSAAPP